MREKELAKTQITETQDENAQKSEPKPRETKKRAYDTLTEDNPFICRGID